MSDGGERLKELLLQAAVVAHENDISFVTAFVGPDDPLDVILDPVSASEEFILCKAIEVTVAGRALRATIGGEAGDITTAASFLDEANGKA
jgi:hypothetical protein